MSSARKWLIVLLVVGAGLSVILAAIWMASGGTGRRGTSGVRIPGGNPPSVVFADGVSSGNTEADEFIRNFIDLCRRGDYEQYRLCWTAYGMPMSGERFQTIWKFARKVVITRIIPVPRSIKVMHPAYVVRGYAELDPKARIATKDVEVMVQWEENRWAVAPAPRLDEDEPSAVTDSAPASQPHDAAANHG